MTTKDVFLAFIFTIFGVFVYEHLSVGIVLVILLFLGLIFWKTKSKTLVIAVIAGLLLGFFATALHLSSYSWAQNETPNQKINGSAKIISSKQNSFGYQYVAEINLKDIKQKVILETNNLDELSMGDTADFVGTITEPENFAGEYGKVFDYKNYLRSKDIFFIVKNAKLSNMQKQNEFSLGHRPMGEAVLKILDNIKNQFENNLEKTIHEPAVSLVEGMIVGDKGAMTKSDSDSFRKSGLIHMVVLSGYNISVVSAFVLAILRRLGRKTSLVSASVIIILFVLMTGASATAVRAGVMGTLVLLGNLARRKIDVLRLLSFAGIFMTVISPLSALYDPSFQLSFLATFGLIAFGPWASSKLTLITEKYGLREVVSATVGSQIMTLPYLAYSVGAVSVVSLFANVLVLPLAPFLMFFGFITGLIFLPFIHLPFSFVTSLLSKYVFAVSNFFASLPFAMLSTSIINGPMTVALYVPLCFIGYRFYVEDGLKEGSLIKK